MESNEDIIRIKVHSAKSVSNKRLRSVWSGICYGQDKAILDAVLVSVLELV
jgi:hypothetical protein